MQRWQQRRTLLLLVAWLASPALFAAGDIDEERVLAEAASGRHWPLKGGNFRGEHFSPLREINDRTVKDLGLAWFTELPVPDGISATPIVVDGVVYLSGAWSLVSSPPGRCTHAFRRRAAAAALPST